jgi:hypothetical protein
MNRTGTGPPVWRDAQMLLLAIEQAVRGFPRYHKYTLGTDLRRQAMVVCRLIRRAWRDREHTPRHLDALVDAVDDLKLQVWTSLWAHWPALGFWFEPPTSLDAPLRPRWEPPGVTGYNSQRRFFRHQWPGAVLLVQRGNQFERLVPAPGAESGRVDRVAATSRSEPGTPGAALPMRRLDAVMTQLRRHCRTHVLITEAGHLKGGLKRRVLRRVVLFEPLQGEPPCALTAA